MSDRSIKAYKITYLFFNFLITDKKSFKLNDYNSSRTKYILFNPIQISFLELISLDFDLLFQVYF